MSTDILRLLNKLEWAGSRQGPGTSMGAYNGSMYKACLICGQLQKPNGDFIDDIVGHKLGCEMKKALEELRR